MELQRAYTRTKRVKLHTGKGLTEQSHKNETNINFILKDYKRTGFIKHAKDNQGKYDDISVQDFQEAMFIVSEANNMFQSLPGAVRKDFENNPQRFLEFVQNPANSERMKQLGILKGNDGLDLKGMPTTAPVIPQPPAAETIPDASQETKTE